ncbi:alpha/beta fold hydrolase [Actinomadura sp. 9N215]|uniref:S9 family peptidase n=1 Tax=Actinomadura sp. 9N215 TaxID=3375150 RepID=UPI0037B92722
MNIASPAQPPTLSPAPAAGPRTLIPRRVLFGAPDRLNPALSPDGRLLGFAAPIEGVMNVWIQPVDGSAPARPVTHDRGRGITEFTLCAGGRLLIRQDTDGDENWRLSLLDLPDQFDEQPDEQPRPRLVTPEHGDHGPVQAKVVAYHPQWHPDQMLIAANVGNPGLRDLYRLDLNSGELRLVESNPGHDGDPPFTEWLADTDLHVRGGMAPNPDGSCTVHVCDEPGGPWRPLLHLPVDDVSLDTRIDFTRDGTRLIMGTSVQARALRLAYVDVCDGAITTIDADPDHDVVQAWLDPDRVEPVVAVYAPDRNRYQLLDPDFAADLDDLTALDEGDVSVIGWARGGRLLLAETTAPHAPVRYYLYDRDSRQAQFLFHQRDDLTQYALAPMEPFALVARDGLDLRGYLTRPPGAPDGPLPTVLVVHGGPWARDRWEFHPEAQWLANRGYAVIQVNYRGSSGYGTAHMAAGDRQWGRAMQNDLLDTLTHFIDEGVADAGRVAIYGGSYGGYTALCGAVFNGNVFTAAVAACAPTDLTTLITSLPPYAQPMREQLCARVGHPERDADWLREVSPAEHADKIRVPLLIAHGVNDVRVPAAQQVDTLIAALETHQIPYRHLKFDGEGHGLVRPQNRETFYAAVEEFLARHLGGACGPS